jgi:hypothetical protein
MEDLYALRNLDLGKTNKEDVDIGTWVENLRKRVEQQVETEYSILKPSPISSISTTPTYTKPIS